MKIRVLHLLRSNVFSGAENVVCQIMSLFSEHPDFDMIYCSPDGKIRASLAEKNVPFLALDSFTPKALKKVIETYRPTLIHAHDAAASVLVAHTVRKIKIISHIHSNHLDMRKISFKSLLYRYYSRRFSHVFWVSESAFTDYRFWRSIQGKSSVLYNILRLEELRAAADAPCDSFDVIYLGRLCYPKNPERLIRVFSKISKACPDASMCIVGDGEMRKEVEDAIKAYSLSDKVKMLGFQSNPKPVLARGKLMLMTSRFEGLPMCALEAMGLGVPIVTTRTDGLCALVDDGENGFLRDDDDALAECAVSLLQDPALRERFSMSALQKAAAWNDEAVYVDALMKHYQ